MNHSTVCNAINKIWEVVIIGAGSAGSTAAIHLARKGHRVLLLDKDDFPRDKVCGDGLIADAISALHRADLYEQVKSRGFETSVGTVYSPSRISFDVRGQFITLKRLVLDDLMVKKTLSSGAWFCRCRLTDIGILPDDTLTISFAKSTEFTQARIVFFATGVNVALPTRLELVTNLFSNPWLNDYVARRISRSQFLQEAFAGLVNETIDPRKIFSLRGILRSFWR